MIHIRLNDGAVREYDLNVSLLQVAKDISKNLAKDSYCALVDGRVTDMRARLDEDCQVEFKSFDSDEGKRVYRHSTSHILAQAVKRLYKDVKLAIGPATDEGFYYDFDNGSPFTKENIKEIEKEMKKIIKEDLPIEHFEMPRKEAISYMRSLGEKYKEELINDLPEDSIISFYKQGEFVDLCAGPHVMSTGKIKAFKLTSENGSSGAYWRGSEKNQMLNRIYGTSFTTVEELEKYLSIRAEAIKRDHNKVGRELKYFTTSDIVGQGLPLLMPKGAKVVQLLQRFVEDEEEKRGYILTKTPFMAKSDLYKVSGHWDHYKEGMFVLGDEEKDEDVFALRPMTCPFQFTIYNAEQHSYRELPIRYNETSTLFRNEASGEMHGLIRVRQFTLSEGHLVCTREQLNEEFLAVVDLIDYLMNILGIKEDISYRFSKWDPNNKDKYIGDATLWEETQDHMRNLLNGIGLEFTEAEGEAAFYGPKLDIQCKNAFGKEDTLITVQIDFALAERFGMTYIDHNGEKKHPIVIHRSSVGCYERTLAILIEKYNGAFPLWLSPVQAIILPISDKYEEYSKQIKMSMERRGIRVSLDNRSEKIGYKIREARRERIPYLLIVGDKEQASGAVSVRSRHKGDEGSFEMGAFVDRMLREIESKSNFANEVAE